ncbi:MAG: Serine/threonine-protein kinase PrkC, partial [Planctomycetota bacterium]
MFATLGVASALWPRVFRGVVRICRFKTRHQIVPKSVSLTNPAMPNQDDSTVPPASNGSDDPTILQPNKNTSEANNAGNNDLQTLDYSQQPQSPQSNTFSTLPSGDDGQESNRGSGPKSIRYFGDYEVIHEIARGGMGVVFKARQKKLNRLVAIKMILSGELASDEAVSRFFAEAQAAATLDHPGIVPVYEIGQHDGQHYFSMGYVEGKSLADRVAKGPLPPKEAAEITRKIAEAIAYAHDKGVIHRDLKPANVLMDANGEPKVTDFGLARIQDQSSGMTRTGAVMGTPSYMPPEQAAGKTTEVGPLSDVYSLGALLYCLLTGRPPFQAATPLDTLMQVIEKEPVSVQSLNAGVPKDLETICQKCLQKESSKRYASAQAFADDLGRWIRGEPIQARAVSSSERAIRWVKRNKLVSGLVAGTLAAILIGAGASLWFGIESKVSEAKAKASEEQAINAMSKGNITLATIELERQRTPQVIKALYSIPESKRNIEWYLLNDQLFNGDHDCYHHASEVQSLTFSEDGKTLASATRDEIAIVNLETNRPVIRIDMSQRNLMINSVHFSSDSNFLGIVLFSFIGKEEDKNKAPKIIIWDIAGNSIKHQISDTDYAIDLAFSSDSTKFYTATQTQFWGQEYKPKREIRIWSMSDGRSLGSSEDFSEDIGGIRYSDIQDSLLVQTAAGKLFRLNQSNSPVEIVLPHNAHLAKDYMKPGIRTLSLDENKVVDNRLIGSLRVLSMDGSETLKIGTGNEKQICFSPDGTRVVFVENNRIVVWNVSLNKLEFESTREFSTIEYLALCPEGRRIATAHRNGVVKIWTLNRLSYNASKRLAIAPCEIVSASSDGKTIIGFKNSSILKIDAADGKVLDEIKLPRSRSNRSVWIDEMAVAASRGLAIVSMGANLSSNGVPLGRLEVWDLENRKLVRLLCKDTAISSSVSISDDGKYVANVMGDNKIAIWDTETGERVRILEACERQANNEIKPCDAFDVAFIPETRTLIARRGFGIQKGEIDQWEKSIISKNGHTSFSSGGLPLSFSQDGTYVMTQGDKESIVLWDANTLEVKGKIDIANESITGVALSKDNDRLGITTRKGDFRIYDIEDGTECFRISLSSVEDYSSSHGVSLSPLDGSWLVRTSDSMFRFQPYPNKMRPVRFLISPIPTRILDFSDDNRKLYGEFGDLSGGRKLIWDIETGRLIEDGSGFRRNLNSMED